MEHFLHTLGHYCIEVLPALAAGFFISGLIHEFIPTSWVERYLGRPGVMPILASTFIGTLLPICCWGSLPV
ncbi:MAG: permease, partial [Candidatus Omnitrophota bacterium]